MSPSLTVLASDLKIQTTLYNGKLSLKEEGEDITLKYIHSFGKNVLTRISKTFHKYE
jgi:hypothetical protein